MSSECHCPIKREHLMSSSGSETIVSPCINRCCLDEAGLICVGCLRTLDEIIDWGTASEEEKRAIMQAVAKRREEGYP